MFGIPRKGECDYSTVLELDLATVEPSVAGPKRPQDRINLPDLKDKFVELLQKPVSENGYNKPRKRSASGLHAIGGYKSDAIYHLTGGGEQETETAPAIRGQLGKRKEHQRVDRDRDDEQPPDARPR